MCKTSYILFKWLFYGIKLRSSLHNRIEMTFIKIFKLNVCLRIYLSYDYFLKQIKWTNVYFKKEKINSF